MSYHGEIVSAASELAAWLDLRHEQGCRTSAISDAAARVIRGLAHDIADLPGNLDLLAKEPDDLESIRALRPRGPRVIHRALTNAQLRDRILGAWLGRAAGCLLGIPCEGMSREEIAASCEAVGQTYPLRDYWRRDPKPPRARNLQYGVTPRAHMLKPNMKSAGADDDLAYTQLGLLIIEAHGIDFTSEDVGRAWLRYLPMACTAERIALDNLRDGLKPPCTARVNNPYVEWIGADIRSDPWGYAAAGCPEAAAEFAHRDATVSHTRNGVFGAMYFSAVIAAALVVDDVEEALRIGLTEIPRKSRMARTVKETLRWCARDRSFDRTVDRIVKRYAGMSHVHTLNNAALTIAGLMHGQGDLGKTIGLTVMGGMDTDCTAATAGSIAGAVLGASKLPARWTKPLGVRAETYLIGNPRFTHRDIARRFQRIATAVRERCGA